MKTPEKINLDNLKKDNPFKVPKHYFNGLQAQIANKISSRQTTKRNLVWEFIQPKLKPALIMAGLALLVGLFIVKPFGKTTKLSESELASLYQYDALSTTNETDLMHELELLNTKNEVAKDSTLKNATTDEIETYIKNNVDITTIVDAL